MAKSKKLKTASIESVPVYSREPAEQLPSIAAVLRLQSLVFWAGAVLMGLEIVGSRVLAPHFGNSVFVWGSLISVFLIALSLGYYLGGRIADRYPSRLLLNSICIVVSLWIAGLAIVARATCEAVVAQGFGEQSGPLLASMLLFLPPSVGMGMVSPFAVRLSALSVSSVGKIAGTLYALSTVGSIAGTLITTFVLIPQMGVSTILKGLGLVLLVVSLLTLPSWRMKETVTRLCLMLPVVIAIILWPSSQAESQTGETIMFDADTPYHHISVVDNKLQPARRELRFDRYVESAIMPDPPYATLCEYTNYFHLAFLANPKIHRTLFIGAGGGVGPRAFHMHDAQMEIDVVDIDPKVLELAQSMFYLEKSGRIRTIAKDGRMFVREAEQPYDCIILDAFSIGGRIPFHLVTAEFLELCRGKLTADGVFVMNINSAVEGPRSEIYQAMHATIASVFPNCYAFAIRYDEFGKDRPTNIIFVALKNSKPISAEEWQSRAHAHRSKSYVGQNQLEIAVGDLLMDSLDRGKDGSVQRFTDNYAPIETMPF